MSQECLTAAPAWEEREGCSLCAGEQEIKREFMMQNLGLNGWKDRCCPSPRRTGKATDVLGDHPSWRGEPSRMWSGWMEERGDRDAAGCGRRAEDCMRP